jgi:adenine-specific DNA-methyltransferase
LQDILKPELLRTRQRLNVSIKQRDTLSLRPKSVFDAVIVNPPYGRVFGPDEKLLNEFSEVITDGHVNRYALFARQAMRWAKPGGIVCLIIPMSFLGGPYFSEFRKYLLTEGAVMSLDPIEQRSELFMDVLCDVCVLTVRKHGHKKQIAPPTSSLLKFHDPPLLLGNLDVPPTASGRAWALPDASHNEKFFNAAFESLEDYGYFVKTGYFVWNREQKRYRIGHSPRSNEVPLYWAHNVRANAACKPLVGDMNDDESRIGFAAIGKECPAIVRTDAIIVQRTSNSRQKRRLIAAIIRQKMVPGGKGFVSENHTLLILPRPDVEQKVSLRTLCRLLNSEAVDSRFRRISGTVSVSVGALRVLPLPCPAHVNATFKACPDDDCAARSAYALTTKKAALLSNRAQPGVTQ